MNKEEYTKTLKYTLILSLISTIVCIVFVVWFFVFVVFNNFGLVQILAMFVIYNGVKITITLPKMLKETYNSYREYSDSLREID